MIRPALASVLGLAVTAAAVPQVGQQDRPPEAPAPRPRLAAVPHKVVRVTPPDARMPGEVAVAINPRSPDHVVVSSYQAARPGKPHTNNFTHNSTDGGRTWAAVPAPNPDGRNQADDSVAFGPDGTAFHCYLSAAGYEAFNRAPLKAGSGLFVRRSADGVAWHPPVPVVDHINTAQPMEDKPWVVVDGGADSPHRGNVYVAWTRFDAYRSTDPDHRTRIFFARSRDGGRTFAPPVRVSDKPGGVMDDSNTVEGAVPAVGPKGEVYVAWAGPDGILIDKSEDGGRTFGKDVKVADQVGGWDYPAPGLRRHNGLPVTGCDTSGGEFGGSVYVCWLDRRNGDSDVFVAASRDGARTWGEPVRVNTDPPRNGKDQLFAWMAVDPADGSVNVVFFDRRDNTGPADLRAGVTVARSVDGGRTFANFPVAIEAFPTPGLPGDYNGIAARGGRVVAAFPHMLKRNESAVSAALFRFRPGTLDPLADD
jgi:hypothetical protein